MVGFKKLELWLQCPAHRVVARIPAVRATFRLVPASAASFRQSAIFKGALAAARYLARYLVGVITVSLSAGRGRVLAAASGLIALIAAADWAIGNRASLGLLYILPMILAASVLRPASILPLALLCSALRSWFDIPAPPLEISLRFLFAFLSYAGLGLFVVALIRNREAAEQHLTGIRREQELRHKAEEQLEILVESSPAAIITLDSTGTVIGANRAADALLILPAGQKLRGCRINAYLPVLADALQFDPGPAGLRTATQCQGVRANGEIFLASLWFSSWSGPEGKRLAAIVVDISEEMRDREEENLRQFLQTNQIAAAAVSHEVRNLCAAISVVSSNLQSKLPLGPDDDLQALTSLVNGLEKVASVELQTRSTDALEAVSLQSVLDDLRIVIEPEWREIGGEIHWRLPRLLPDVFVERYGLLQAFLNIAQNSHRAVQTSSGPDCARELSITAVIGPETVIVRFHDSGPGVAAPERLFAPFQTGASGTGLGLYVSRAVVRGYGGDLRWEPTNTGSCFAVELQKDQEDVS